MIHLSGETILLTHPRARFCGIPYGSIPSQCQSDSSPTGEESPQWLVLRSTLWIAQYAGWRSYCSDARYALRAVTSQ